MKMLLQVYRKFLIYVHQLCFLFILSILVGKGNSLPDTFILFIHLYQFLFKFTLNQPIQRLILIVSMYATNLIVKKVNSEGKGHGMVALERSQGSCMPNIYVLPSYTSEDKTQVKDFCDRLTGIQMDKC